MAFTVTTRGGKDFVYFHIFVFSFWLCLLSSTEAFNRQITVQVNPNSNSTPPGGDLLHVRAVGENDTLHFLFCSQGAPTLLVVHTNSTSSTLKVNWTQFLARNISGSITVEPQSSVQDSFAVVFSRLFEYNDVNNTAKPDSSFFAPYELRDFNWDRLRLSNARAVLCGSAPTFENGSLCLQLSVFDSDGRAESWPRLRHSANSSQVELWLSGVPPRAENSRFMLELQSVAGDDPLSCVGDHRFIDDEYTPSIFKVSQWVNSPGNDSSNTMNFVQWKPVAYRRSHPALEDATPCRHSDPQSQSGETVAASSALVLAFFSEPKVTALNMSFGIAGDPFYNSTKFLSWTMLVGIGAPPIDSFSAIVITIMAVGLGMPLVLMMLGGICICLHKRREGTGSNYEPIN